MCFQLRGRDRPITPETQLLKAIDGKRCLSVPILDQTDGVLSAVSVSECEPTARQSLRNRDPAAWEYHERSRSQHDLLVSVRYLRTDSFHFTYMRVEIAGITFELSTITWLHYRRINQYAAALRLL